MSVPSLPRTSYARKMNGLSVTPLLGARRINEALDHRDRFDLDEPVRMRQRGDGDQRGGGALLAEELLSNGHEVGAVADVGEVGIHLDDALHRRVARLDLRLHRLAYRARLR